MAEFDRPKRPNDDETFLLNELVDMPRGCASAVEEVLQYCDDLEAYCDSLDGQIDDLMTELGEAHRTQAAQTHAEAEVARLANSNRQLVEEIANQRKSMDALAHAMGETERQEWESKLANVAQVSNQAQEALRAQLGSMTQELALAQSKLIAIHLLIR